MNLLAAESVDRQIVDRLRREGHTIRYVAEMEPGMLVIRPWWLVAI